MIFHLSASQDFGGSGDDFAGSGDGNGLLKTTAIIIPAVAAKVIKPAVKNNRPASLKVNKLNNKPMIAKIIRKKRTTANNMKKKPIIPHDIPIWHES